MSKISHWIFGDITPKKRGSNQYKTKRKQKGSLSFGMLIVFIILGLIVYLGIKSQWTSIEPQQLETKVEQSDLTPEQVANLQKQSDLAKREAIAMNKQAKIEAELEQIRSEKLSLK